jgi:hypothetical protein
MTMATNDINQEILKWLEVPTSDANFKGALERADEATIRAALDGGIPLNATKKKTLETRLRQLQKKPTLAELYAQEQKPQKQLDPVSEAVMEVVEVERKQVEIARNEQSDKERRIAECHQFIGRIQAVDMVGKLATVSTLMWLKDVKGSKLYRDLPGIETWDKFCDSLGKSRRLIDEQLLNLEAFGVDFLETVSSLRVGYREMKKLRQLTHEGALQVEDGILVIGDEEIPLDADHREDLQAAMARLLDAKEQVIQEKAATIRTKERLLESKEQLIHRQEKALAVYENQAQAKGLTADEDAYIQKCTNARTTIDGFLMQFDPDRNPLPDDATPRMKAALMETLGYFRRAIVAAHDTAGDIYGDAEMDSPGWVQPNLRDVAESLGDSLADARAKAKKS